MTKWSGLASGLVNDGIKPHCCVQGMTSFVRRNTQLAWLEWVHYFPLRGSSTYPHGAQGRVLAAATTGMLGAVSRFKHDGSVAPWAHIFHWRICSTQGKQQHQPSGRCRSGDHYKKPDSSAADTGRLTLVAIDELVGRDPRGLHDLLARQGAPRSAAHCSSLVPSCLACWMKRLESESES